MLSSLLDKEKYKKEIKADNQTKLEKNVVMCY